MQIETERLILREFTLADSASIVRQINNLKVSENLIVVPHPITRQQVEDLIRWGSAQDRDKPAEVHLGITLKDKDDIIGSVRLEKFDHLRETASLGYWLGEEFWGKGYMTEAASAMINFGFTTLKLRRISVSAFVENTASNALIKKLGFVHEGTSKQKARSMATGIIHDENDYGLLKEEWMMRK